MFHAITKSKLFLSQPTPYLTIELEINNRKLIPLITKWLNEKYDEQQYSYTGDLFLIDNDIASFAFLSKNTLSVIAIFSENISSEIGSAEIKLTEIKNHLINTTNTIIESFPDLTPGVISLDISKTTGA